MNTGKEPLSAPSRALSSSCGKVHMLYRKQLKGGKTWFLVPGLREVQFILIREEGMAKQAS